MARVSDEDKKIREKALKKAKPKESRYEMIAKFAKRVMGDVSDVQDDEELRF